VAAGVVADDLTVPTLPLGDGLSAELDEVAQDVRT
jgi:hypothetical protein